MAKDRITVEAMAPATLEDVWKAYTSPEEITRWNYASGDWHCPAATVDLREGGKFTSRMEAKDGSLGFDFEGTYTRIVPNERIEYAFGERLAAVHFTPVGEQTNVTISFDPDDQYSIEQQRVGWAAILDNFCKHVARR